MYDDDSWDSAPIGSTETMSERDVEERLHEAIDALSMIGDQDPDEFADEIVGPLSELGVRRVLTFDDAGVMTRNKGLVLRLNDGSEFQITIVRSV